MSAVVIAGDTSGSITLAAPAVAGTTTLTLPATSGTVLTTATGQTLTSPVIAGTPTGVGVLTLGTAVSVSGTSVDFTSIPSWVKRITVLFAGVSTSGTSIIIIQLGDSGGFETSGYSGVASYLDNAASAASTATTTGIALSAINTAPSTWNGEISISNYTGNGWTASGTTANPEIPRTNPTGYNKILSDRLDRIRITTVNGTDTFDAGILNIIYE
jgi:hypothetical protein